MDAQASQGDDGQIAHDDEVVKSIHDQAIVDMRRRNVKMTQTEEKMAQKIFPMVLISGFSFGFYCSSYIIQIAGLARKIHDSSTLNEKFQAEVSHNPDLQTSAKHALDRRVPTRWNADFLCLSAHLHFKSVIQSMTGVSENKLKPYRLSDEQWELSDDLGDVLKVFIVFYYCAFMLIFK